MGPYRLTTLLCALSAAAATLVGAPGQVATASASLPAQASPNEPQLVIDQNFPDPVVIKVGSTYYAYATGGGGKRVQIATSESVFSGWQVLDTPVLPNFGDWARETNSDGSTVAAWAPEVTKRADGSYLMYYTAPEKESGARCIGTAVADSPGGPFQPVGNGPPACPADRGGAIDAAAYTADDGTRYVAYKIDGNSVGKPSPIMLQRMSANGVEPRGEPTELTRRSEPYEKHYVEAPALVKHGDSFVLLYSSGYYNTRNYDTGFAWSQSLDGTYRKPSHELMTTASTSGNIIGPGHPDVLMRQGIDYIFFHGILNPNRGEDEPLKRGMYVSELYWANDHRPVVRGARVIYEAGNASLNHCRVRTNVEGASLGKVVGYIDYADSRVRFRVYAPEDGRYTLAARYANGSANNATATHTVAVNGADAGVMTYPWAGWDNWREASRQVRLRQGWNTITFGHGQHYAELDYIAVE